MLAGTTISERTHGCDQQTLRRIDHTKLQNKGQNTTHHEGHHQNIWGSLTPSLPFPTLLFLIYDGEIKLYIVCPKYAENELQRRTAKTVNCCNYSYFV